MCSERADRSRAGPIVLVGFMGAGKSSIGRALAKRLGVPFVDTDALVEQSFGLSVAEIFRQFGEVHFRAAERNAISKLALDEAAVVAIGGGAFLDPVNREALNRGSLTVWLDAPIDLILTRLMRSADRPLALSRSESELRALWEERRHSYAQASVRIDASDGDPERIAARIVATFDSCRFASL